MAWSVERLTLGFNSGHNLEVCGFEPHPRLCADSVVPAWDSVSLSLKITNFKIHTHKKEMEIAQPVTEVREPRVHLPWVRVQELLMNSMRGFCDIGIGGSKLFPSCFPHI